MTAVRYITIDCSDAHTLGSFWAAVLGHPIAEDDVPGDTEVLLRVPDGPDLLFVQVPEAKTVKNRLHMEIVPDTTRDEEVARLLTLGATIFGDQRMPDGRGWVTMRDVEGNEFCVLRSDAEKAAG